MPTGELVGFVERIEKVVSRKFYEWIVDTEQRHQVLAINKNVCPTFSVALARWGICIGSQKLL